MTSVVVVADWQTTEESIDTVRDLLADLRPRSLAEPGCEGYEIFQQRDDPTGIVLIERYRDEDALAAHQASDHYQDIVVAKIRPLLTERRVQILRPWECGSMPHSEAVQ
ncbi:putative quinol monooxygenase [Mycobacterium sp. 3519A]|uniref:putative quinol monooxygenase n=1 Tax=Mycobacterium sp. 3519A TaxID=2057184 RepID=UPI00190EAD2E|nr:putative quinol monooxygenase [Mycobacterium sp. 3519A]